MFPSLLEEEDEKALARLLAKGLTCSEHSFTGGGRGRSFLSLDKVLASPGYSGEIVSLLVKAVRRLQEDGTTFDKLGYIDAASRGPVGLLSCRTEIGREINVPSVIVRPGKRLHASQISGELMPGDRVLFLCDVLTTGHHMAQAYAICARRQARVVSSIFVYDRLLAGSDNLAAIGLSPHLLTNRARLYELAPDELGPHEQAVLSSPPTPRRVDLLPYLTANI